MAGGATGGWGVDRGDRPRGRPRSLHRVVLGAQARPDLVARRAPRGARADRARAAHRDRRRATSRCATWPTCWSAAHRRAALASPPWPGDRPHEARARSQSRARRRCRHRRPAVPAPRADAARAARGRLPVRAMRGGHVAAWRREVKRILVVEAGGACKLCGYADATPPCSSITSIRHEALRAQPSGGHALPRQGPGGGREMRAPVRQLPREGRGWARSTSPKIGRSSRLSCVAQECGPG